MVGLGSLGTGGLLGKPNYALDVAKQVDVYEDYGAVNLYPPGALEYAGAEPPPKYAPSITVPVTAIAAAGAAAEITTEKIINALPSIHIPSWIIALLFVGGAIAVLFLLAIIFK